MCNYVINIIFCFGYVLYLEDFIDYDFVIVIIDILFNCMDNFGDCI